MSPPIAPDDIMSVVYRPDFMKRHHDPLKERLDASGLAQASQSLGDLIYPLITGPEIALLLAEDCLTEMSTLRSPAEVAMPIRGFASVGLTHWTGQLAMEAAIRTLHCSGDFFGQMLNAAGLASTLPEGDYHAFDVLMALPKHSDIKRAFGGFLNSTEYKRVADTANEMKHRQLVRTTYQVSKPIGEPARSIFFLRPFERDGVTYPETDPTALRMIIDELRTRGGAVMDETLAAL